jgi:hypothetical protein
MSLLTPEWQTFFAAQVNAAAALTGLVVVAISVNITRIVENELLPERAVEALIALVGALVLACLLLMPGQPPQMMAVECGIVGALMLFAPLRYQLHAWRSEVPNERARPIVRALMTGLGGAPMLIAAALLGEGATAGFYWAAAGLTVSLVVGVVGAWVLLVEILR